MVADADAMGVVAEIFKNLPGPRERRLGVEVPVGLVQTTDEPVESVGVQVATDAVRSP
jgi:hypothetical protein